MDAIKILEQLGLLNFVVAAAVITIIGLAMNLFLYYMIGLVKQIRVRNLLSTVVIFACTVLYLRGFRPDINYDTYRNFLYMFLVHVSLSVILYIAVDYIFTTMKIVDRIDSKMDSLGFKDTAVKKKTIRKKK